MTTALIAAAVLLLIPLVAFVGVVHTIEQARRQKEHDQIKKDLQDEILNGGNVTRITALRKRMQELEDAGCGWR